MGRVKFFEVVFCVRFGAAVNAMALQEISNGLIQNTTPGIGKRPTMRP